MSFFHIKSKYTIHDLCDELSGVSENDLLGELVFAESITWELDILYPQREAIHRLQEAIHHLHEVCAETVGI